MLALGRKEEKPSADSSTLGGEDIGRADLSGLDDFAGFNAAGADLHPAVAARWELNSNGLKVRIEPPSRLVICVGNVIAKLRAFPTNVTSLCHKIIASDIYRGVTK